MLANTAVGGGWAEAPNGETAHMDIDYIRAYSNDANAHAVSLNGMSSPDGADTSGMYGAAAANVTGSVTTPAAPAAPKTTIKLHVSGDQYQGTPHFDVRVNGLDVASHLTTRAVHGNGQWSDVQVSGDFGPSGPQKVAIHFTDDAYGGTASTDKNLYVDYVEINGKRYQGETATNHAAAGNEAYDPKAAVMASDGWMAFNTGSKAAGASEPGHTIVGTNADETLQGTAGADIVRGFGGSDKLTGGAGADTFVFNNPASHDNVITDFAAGLDKLWVKGLMKGYSGSHPFADHVLSISDSAAGAVISFDPDGNGPQAGHTLVTLQHVTADHLKASDFIWH
jgi:Ca2+-binding RTX toxin-like protein